MRHFKLLSLLVVLALALSACGAPANVPPAVEEKAAEVVEQVQEKVEEVAPTVEAAVEEVAPTVEAAVAEAVGGELKIAVLAPLSGPVPTFGVMTRDGALLAIEEWNAKGGVNGMKIVPVVEDSQCTPDPAVNAANKVIDQDGVKFIVGEVCSSASIPISEIANPKGVIQISPTSTNPAVTVGADGLVKDYIFRACFIDPFQGQVGAKFAMEELDAKTAFIMLDQANDYVKGLAEFFEASFTEAGGTVVGKETYTAKDTDFSAILAKVAEAKPDVIYLPDYYNIVNLVTQQAKEKGITAPFIGGDGWDSSDLNREAAAGGFFTNHYSPEDPRAEVQDFVKNFGAKYQDDQGAPKTPDALAALAYDATNLLISAIQAAGTDDTAVVRESMAGIEFNGVSGKITFDENHNPVKSATILEVTADGIKFKSVVNP
jgi:branched-chain amino acid transport system substrate-binding protein